MFLLIFTAILGAIAGLVVGVVRSDHDRARPGSLATGIAIATAAAGGAAIVHTDGVDFRILEPLWLTVGLFVLLPGLWAATVVVVTDRLLRSTHLAGEPVRLDRGRWRAIGWVLLVVITTLGVQDLVADVASLG